MPEEPNPEAARPPARKRAVGAEAKLAKLKKKYRLDETVKIDAIGRNGQPLGVGPLLDPQVFDKFAELDETPEKRYLDWMLYQAGGGPEALKNSLLTWGDGIEPKDPKKVLDEWNRAARGTERVESQHISHVARKLQIEDRIKPVLNALLMAAREAPDDPAKYAAMVRVLQERKVVPGQEEKVARDIMTVKLKKYLVNVSDVKARDRIHTLSIYIKILKGESPEEFEQEWVGGFEQRKKREYVLGDEDHLRYKYFAFARHWPGAEGRYEKVYNEMKQFLINKARVETRMAKLDQWNAQIKAKNAELNLPAEQAIPLREPINVALDIGTVTLTKDIHLVYKGPYPTLAELAKVNAQIEELPMRERVQSDVRFAGPKGKIGRGEKIFSDANLDVLVPLTVMAAIKSGHPAWDISDPEQINDLKTRSYSAWQRAHEVGRYENSSGSVTLIFVLKNPEVPEEFRKIRLTAPLSELSEISPTDLGGFVIPAKFSPGKSGPVDFKTIVHELQGVLTPEAYRQTVSSFSRAFRGIREWGQEFDPRSIIPDFATYHRDKLKGRRGLREMIQFRAQQVVARLLEE